jgi:ADP-ribosylglycohydrolase
MALCLANSLVARRDYVPYDQLVRYKWWYQEGYMSSTGSCFDIGSATKHSLQEFERRQKEFAKKHKIPFEEIDFLSDPALLDKFDVNCSEDGVAGNGPLMRLAPVPLFFYLHPVDAVEYSGRSGKITHGDKKAYDACRYYGALIVAAVNGASRDELLDKRFYENHKKWFGDKSLHSDIINIAHGSYQKKEGYAEGIRGKGYIVSALEAALWAFWSDEGSFAKGVLAAVNLGDDTDTTAAIYGQLAGAHYGYKNLPEKWAEQVYAKDFIGCLSKWMVYEGKRWALKQSTILSVIVESPSKFDGALPPFKETNSNRHPQPTKDQRSRSKSFENNQTTPMMSTLMSAQSGDHKSDYGSRRYSTHDKAFTLQPNSREQHALHRPASAENLNPTSSSQRKGFKEYVKNLSY